MTAIRSGIAPVVVAACFLAAWRWGPAGHAGARKPLETNVPTREQQPDIAGRNT
jgi:hypothetical protein